MASEQFERKYQMNWEVLDVIVSGRSAIDAATGFQFTNEEAVKLYINRYGYDLDNPIEKAEVQGNFQEAISFIRKYFLKPDSPTGLAADIPKRIAELKNISDLFIMASFTPSGPGSTATSPQQGLTSTGQTNQKQDPQGPLHKAWACAILKVMHTIAHLDKDIRTGNFSDIQKQILDRFYRAVHRDDDGNLYLSRSTDSEDRVKLVQFDTKPKKSRDSTLLKMLHKPENVAEDIFDKIGIRFVTESRLDALRVIKLLKDLRIVIPPNIKPSRSRNTLVYLDTFREEYLNSIEQVSSGEISETEWVGKMEESLKIIPAAKHSKKDPANEHSSQEYRAIQFTCRQLIKIANPLHAEIRDLKKAAKEDKLHTPVYLGDLIEKLDLKHIAKETRFFYPYEVQIVDRESALENEKGRASHDDYKKSQVQTALKRVMNSVIHATKNQGPVSGTNTS